MFGDWIVRQAEQEMNRRYPVYEPQCDECGKILEEEEEIEKGICSECERWWEEETP